MLTFARSAIAVLTVALVGCTPASTPAGRYATLRGIRMYYEIHGTGRRTLLLLHGGAGHGSQFEHQVPDFEKKFRVIVPDMCAQGRTSDRPGPLTYHAMAEDVIALLDQLHVRRFDVMGWSDGGNTGLDLAIHHRDRLDHLVTFGANFSPNGMNAADIAWADTASWVSFGDGMRTDWTQLSPNPADYQDAMTKILTMWRTEPNFTMAELGSIEAKTLISAGEHDVVRQDHSEALAHAIPNASLWIVPGASHSVMMEKPELVNARVLEFLAQ